MGLLRVALRVTWCHVQGVRISVVLFLSLLGVGCADAVGIEPGGVPFEPPVEWAELWRKTEQCSGHAGHVGFDRIEWIRYPTPTIPNAGATIARANKSAWRIELAEQVVDEGVIAHEMLHLLIPEDGHPPKYATMCPHVAAW